MRTFVIFDRKTGEILQTHVWAEDSHYEVEHLLKTARPEVRTESLDVIEVEHLVFGRNYRVELKAKKLVAVDRSKTRGAGAAFVQPAGGDPRTARTIVFRLDEKKKE